MTFLTPRVASLRYRIRAGNGVRFDNPAPYDFDTSQFSGHLDGETLTLVPKRVISTRDEAIAIATTFVESWEIDAGLRVRGRLFAAELEYVAMEGNAPSLGMLRVSADANLERVVSSFPPVPTNFEAGPIAQTLWQRYRAYRGCRDGVCVVPFITLNRQARSRVNDGGIGQASTGCPLSHCYGRIGRASTRRRRRIAHLSGSRSFASNFRHVSRVNLSSLTRFHRLNHEAPELHHDRRSW